MDIVYKCKYCILVFAINVVYFSLQIVLASLFLCHKDPGDYELFQ